MTARRPDTAPAPIMPSRTVRPIDVRMIWKGREKSLFFTKYDFSPWFTPEALAAAKEADGPRAEPPVYDPAPPGWVAVGPFMILPDWWTYSRGPDGKPLSWCVAADDPECGRYPICEGADLTREKALNAAEVLRDLPIPWNRWREAFAAKDSMLNALRAAGMEALAKGICR